MQKLLAFLGAWSLWSVAIELGWLHRVGTITPGVPWPVTPTEWLQGQAVALADSSMLD